MVYKYIVILAIITGSCRVPHNYRDTLKIPLNTTVFFNGDSLNNIKLFAKENDQIMLTHFEADCSTCLLELNDWILFQKRYPKIKYILITSTQQSQKQFWTRLAQYYNEKFYVIFDTNEIIYQNNIYPNHFVIIDSNFKVITEGKSIDEKFEKRYFEALK